MDNQLFQSLQTETKDFLLQPNALRSLLILVAALLVAYWLSRYVSRGIIKVAQFIAVRADNSSSETQTIRLRQVETYLSIVVAIIRVVIAVLAGYIAWRLLSPVTSNSGVAAIGMSAVFIVLAGGTLNPLLRDITAGSAMIVERWFHVGDFIRVDPFWEMGGVVERMTLRSTKLRSLNGEVVWINNQHITAVRVTPRGVRTIAVDLFVNHELKGRKLIDKVIATIPSGTMTLAKPLRITRNEKWGENQWMFTVVGQTPPGREWIIENFFVESLKELDKKTRGGKVLVHVPMVRFEDPAAEKSFKRAVRVASSEPRRD